MANTSGKIIINKSFNLNQLTPLTLPNRSTIVEQQPFLHHYKQKGSQSTKLRKPNNHSSYLIKMNNVATATKPKFLRVVNVRDFKQLTVHPKPKQNLCKKPQLKKTNSERKFL